MDDIERRRELRRQKREEMRQEAERLSYQRNDDDEEEAARERRRRARQERLRQKEADEPQGQEKPEVNAQNNIAEEDNKSTMTTVTTVTNTQVDADDDAVFLERLAKREERRQKRLQEALERQKEFDPTITNESLSFTRRKVENNVEENETPEKEKVETHRRHYELEETETITKSYQRNNLRGDEEDKKDEEGKAEEQEEKPKQRAIEDNQVEVTLEKKTADSGEEAVTVKVQHLDGNTDEQNIENDTGVLADSGGAISITVAFEEKKVKEDGDEAEKQRTEEKQRLEQEEMERVKAEQERKAEEERERLAAEEKERLEAERKAAEEKERLEAERKAAEEKERLEAEKKAAEEKERLEAEEKERIKAEEEQKAEEERKRIEAEEKKAAQEKERREAEERKRAKEAEEKKAAEERAKAKEREKREAEEQERAKAEAKKAAEEKAKLEEERLKAKQKAEEKKVDQVKGKKIEEKKTEGTQVKEKKVQEEKSTAFLKKQGEEKLVKVEAKKGKLQDEKLQPAFKKEEVKDSKVNRDKAPKEEAKSIWDRKKGIPESKPQNGERFPEFPAHKLKHTENAFSRPGFKAASDAEEAKTVSHPEAGKRVEELRRRRGENESEEFEKLKQKQQEAAVELEELKKKREERRKVLEEEEQRRKKEESERKAREEEEKRRLKEEIERRRAEAAEKRQKMPEEALADEKKPFKCFTPKGSSLKIEERAEFLNKSAQKSGVKPTHTTQVVSKIDSRLEQYTSAIEGNKAAKPAKPAASDLLVPAEGVRNIKSMWEKGNVFSSPSGTGTPNKETAGLKVGVSSRINEWLTKTPENSKAPAPKPSDLRPGDVSSKRNLWEKQSVEKTSSSSKVTTVGKKSETNGLREFEKEH
ncbi:caldesmon isoform X2 [Varanus komodoensis]|uniref:caldesmon isoform X2 n=1 Tax=Varanus komodoensis TaxID=61221 RepID=UPI001CF7E62F|nr:caldesmon isoform X2 [Varanus komodoensis]